SAHRAQSPSTVDLTLLNPDRSFAAQLSLLLRRFSRFFVFSPLFFDISPLSSPLYTKFAFCVYRLVSPTFGVDPVESRSRASPSTSLGGAVRCYEADSLQKTNAISDSNFPLQKGFPSQFRRWVRHKKRGR
ncbi:hypothetical protein Dimus_037303, partial [Dionaea muscipula]